MIRSILFPILIALLFSCKKEGTCFTSTGNETTETRELIAFQAVTITDNFNVHFHRSTSFYVTINAGENLLKNIKTGVENNTLKIENANRCNWLRDLEREIRIDVYLDSIQDLTLENAAGLTVFEDTLPATLFTFNSWGNSNDVYLKLNASETYIKAHAGPAMIWVEGSTSYSYIWNGALGNIDASKLRAQNGVLEAHSFGDSYIFSSKTLTINHTEVGSAFYNKSVEKIDISSGDESNIHTY